MGDLTTSGRRSVDRNEQAGTCRYCGAKLMRGYYFCLRCATPYKDWRSVAPDPGPPLLTEKDLIRRKAPHVWPLFWTYVVVVVGTGLISYLFLQEDNPALALGFRTVVLFVTTCVFAAMHFPSLSVQLRKVGFGHPAAWMGLAALVPALAINYGYHAFIVKLAGIPVPDPLARLRQGGLDEATLIFLFCVCPAVLEEIAFRGLVQHWLQAAIEPARALILASALFAALHFSIASAPYLFAVGMLLGWLKWRTGALYPSMLVHLLHNLVVIEFFWRRW